MFYNSQYTLYILFDSPSSGLIFCSWPGSDLGSIKRSILCKMRWRGTTWYNVYIKTTVVTTCKMRWRGTTWYNVTVRHISTVIGGKARYHIRRWPYVVWVRALCTVQVITLNFNSAHGLFVLANWYTMAGHFSWRKRP